MYLESSGRSGWVGGWVGGYLLLDKGVVARDEVEDSRVLFHDQLAELLDGVGLLALEVREVDGWSGWVGGWAGWVG